MSEPIPVCRPDSAGRPLCLVASPDGHAQQLALLREENRQLREALDSRAAVDQALGMIMALAPCGKHRAWRALVDVSQHTNTKVRTVARLLTEAGEQRVPAPYRRALHRALARLRAG
ncbi:ANTAR domain-containing protein [Streptomyces chrestomyceticus]|uniref:ANTAR domain-containing protein n=1 Tax=Streptomyces chrestomyceticus TaxID=68185 RepID=A0ABU7WL63_9ACTN